jgi:phosphoribosylformylglycinamidine synthase
MALAGDTGVALTPHASGSGFWFGEDQARYILAVADAASTLAAAATAGIPAEHIGTARGNSLTLADGDAIFLAELREAHEGFLPAWFA